MAEFVCKVWSSDRRVKKTFMSAASIEAIINEAQKFGILGSKLVLESNGTEICSNAVLEWYMKNNEIFMLLENEEWTERLTTATCVSANQTHFEAIKEPLLDVRNSTATIMSSMVPPAQEVGCSTLHTVMLIPSDTTDDSDCTSLTMSSSALTSSSETTSQAQPLFEHFQIPWQKIPSDIMDMLNNGQKLGRKLNVLANILVDELRMFSFNIPMGILRSVMQQAVTKYPESLLERDSEGNIISVTTTPLLTIMRNRNYFLNRSPNTKPTNLASNIPFKKRRQSNVFQNTCAHWEVREDVPSNALDSMKSKQKYLKTAYANGSEYQQMDLIASKMKDCFQLQRQFFNNMDPVPSIRDIQTNWPFIFHDRCLVQHFQQLMNINADTFCESFKKSQDAFKKFLTAGKSATKNFGSDMEIIEGFAKYFGKNPNFLFINFEIGTTTEDLQQQISCDSPVIAIIGSVKAYIFIEKCPVAEYSEYNFVNLVKIIINYYFVFNKMYPPEISQTLEFLARFCYKHYPNQTRGSKKNINNIQKVNNLISKIWNM